MKRGWMDSPLTNLNQSYRPQIYGRQEDLDERCHFMSSHHHMAQPFYPTATLAGLGSGAGNHHRLLPLPAQHSFPFEESFQRNFMPDYGSASVGGPPTNPYQHMHKHVHLHQHRGNHGREERFDQQNGTSLHPYLYPNQPSVEGSSCLVEVVDVDNHPFSFYCQLVDNFNQFRALMNKLTATYSDDYKEGLFRPQEGMACVAKYNDDGRWYRGKILHVTDSEVYVSFVDYGTTQRTPIGLVKGIHREFVSLPPQAYSCTLDLGVGIGFTAWTPEDKSRFKVATAGKWLNATFKPRQNNLLLTLLTEICADGSAISINNLFMPGRNNRQLWGATVVPPPPPPPPGDDTINLTAIPLPGSPIQQEPIIKSEQDANIHPVTGPSPPKDPRLQSTRARHGAANVVQHRSDSAPPGICDSLQSRKARPSKWDMTTPPESSSVPRVPEDLNEQSRSSSSASDMENRLALTQPALKLEQTDEINPVQSIQSLAGSRKSNQETSTDCTALQNSVPQVLTNGNKVPPLMDAVATMPTPNANKKDQKTKENASESGFIDCITLSDSDSETSPLSSPVNRRGECISSSSQTPSRIREQTPLPPYSLIVSLPLQSLNCSTPVVSEDKMARKPECASPPSKRSRDVESIPSTSSIESVPTQSRLRFPTPVPPGEANMPKKPMSSTPQISRQEDDEPRPSTSQSINARPKKSLFSTPTGREGCGLKCHSEPPKRSKDAEPIPSTSSQICGPNIPGSIPAHPAIRQEAGPYSLLEVPGPRGGPLYFEVNEWHFYRDMKCVDVQFLSTHDSVKICKNNMRCQAKPGAVHNHEKLPRSSIEYSILRWACILRVIRHHATESNWQSANVVLSSWPHKLPFDAGFLQSRFQCSLKRYRKGIENNEGFVHDYLTRFGEAQLDRFRQIFDQSAPAGPEGSNPPIKRPRLEDSKPSLFSSPPPPSDCHQEASSDLNDRGSFILDTLDTSFNDVDEMLGGARLESDITSLRQFKEAVLGFKFKFMESLESAEIGENINKAEDHWLFGPKRLENWISYKQSEMELYRKISQLDGVVILADKHKLKKEMARLSIGSALVLSIPLLDEWSSTISDAMADYIENPSLRKLSTHEEIPWHVVRAKRNEVLAKVAELTGHAASTKDANCFVVYKARGKRFGCCYSVYENGKRIKKNLKELPSHVRSEASPTPGTSASSASPSNVQSERIAEKFARRWEMMGRKGGKELFAVPFKKSAGPNTATFDRFIFGNSQDGVDRKYKTILLMGAVDSGKTLLLNAIINYVFGVDFHDPFRFQLLPVAGERIRIYDIHHVEGSRVPYSLTIVDTPDFSDNNVEQLSDAVHHFLQDKTGIQQLDGVGFLAQSDWPPQLTPTQRHALDTIFSLWGKDVEDKISFLLSTSFDGKTPSVLSAITAAGLPCPIDAETQKPIHFSFDSSDNVNSSRWQMERKNLANFFAHLTAKKPTTLKLTNRVLEEREWLKATVEKIQPSINSALEKLNDLKETKRAIANCQAELDAIKAEETAELKVPQEMELGPGEYVTNCGKCDQTCFMGAVGESQDDCSVCPGRCEMVWHFAGDTYKWYEVTPGRNTPETDEKLAQELVKMQSAREQLEQLQKDVEEASSELTEQGMFVSLCIERLDEMALHPCLKAPDAIEFVIRSERAEKRPGFEQRVKSLEKSLRYSFIIQKIKNKETLLPLDT